LFESLLSQAHALANSGRVGQRFETLRVLDEARQMATELPLGAETTQRLRTETIAALCLPDIELDREIDAWLPGTVMVDFDRHVNRYARGDDTGTITIHRVADGTSLLRLPSPGPGWRIANDGDAVFSPDGRYGLQICRAPEKTTRWLRLWDLDADPPRVVLDVPAALGASFRPNGREIAVSVVDTASEEDTSSESISIHVYDIPSGDDRIVPIPVRAPGEPAFHPTDSKLAIAEERAVRIVDLDTGSDVGRWEQPDLRHLTWSHQGRLLFAASDTDLLIHRWNVTGQRSLSPLEGHTRPGITLALNQVGDLLVSNDSSMNIRLWDSHTGRLLMTATGGTLPKMRYSADYRWLVA
jgi:WD40 repeat protein